MPNKSVKKMRSLRKAINQMCEQCIYDPDAAGTRAVQIALCTAPHCALYDVRPITTTKIPLRVLEEMRLTVEQVDSRVRKFISPECQEGHFRSLEGVFGTNQYSNVDEIKTHQKEAGTAAKSPF